MSLCTTPNTTWTHVYRCVGLWVRVHVLCTCTLPQEHLFCIVYSVFRRLQASVYMYLCTTPYTTWTHVYMCVVLCVRVHVLCTCTSPQEHLSCIVYFVFRRPLPCNPSTANMCIFHRRLRNTTLLSACTYHQIRASQCTHSPP